MRSGNTSIAQTQLVMSRLQNIITWGLGFILCLIAGYTAFWFEISDEENNFKIQTDLVHNELIQRYNTLDAVLTALTGFYQASNNINETRFSAFARELLSTCPYIHSAILLRTLDNKNRHTLEANPHNLGHPQFQVSQSSHDGRLVAAGERPEYLIIDSIEPISAQITAFLGYDVLSNTNFMRAINTATRSDKSVAASFTRLLRKSGSILIFKAIYREPYSSTSIAVRTHLFNGAVAIEVDSDRLLKNLIPETMNLTASLKQTSDQSGKTLKYGLTKNSREKKNGSLLPLLTTSYNLDLYSQTTYLSITRVINFSEINYYWILFSVAATLIVYILALSNWRHRLSNKHHAKELKSYAACAAFSEENIDPIMRINRDGKVLYSNDPGIKVLNEWATSVGEQAPENIKYFIHDVLQQKQYQELDISAVTRHYTLRFIPGSTYDYVNIYGRDDTEQKQAEIELREAKYAAESANIAKSRFLATISHEIRTPMNGILGMLELLQSSESGKKQRHFAATALRSGRVLLSLINDILDFSKMESSKLKLNRYHFDLKEIIDDVVYIISEPVVSKHLHLVTEIPNCDFNLIGDKQRLRQILINIAGNAVKFTEYGKVSIRTIVLSESSNSMLLKIEIEDTGIGIKAEAIDHIFEAFTQEDDSTTRHFGGTGLGLTIVKQLTALMGGDIEVQSTPQKGSIFSITLPFEKQLPTLAPDDTNSINELTSTYALPQGQPNPNPQVLLAEDNRINQEVAAAMLETAGCQVTIVNDGELALQALGNKHFDLVLMDCQMPVMDGLEATRCVRQWQTEYARIPIIALTANVQKHDYEECKKAGMNDYLSKPFTQAEIHKIVARWSPS